MKNLGYGTAIALLFASCGDNDKKENNKIDPSLPIYKGNLIGHSGKGSRNLPIYNKRGQLINYNIGDTAQTMYDNGELELLDLRGGEQNGRNNSGPASYAQVIEDVIITDKMVQYEPVNTTPAK